MEPSEIKNTKFIRVQWDNWNFIALRINNETELNEALKDGSIREGDAIFKVESSFIAKKKDRIILEEVK